MKAKALLELIGTPDPANPDWPFKVAELSEGLGNALSESPELKEISLALGRVADDCGCDAVTGASSLGERLAGAIVVGTDNGLALYSRDHPAGTVLIVDGLLATGAQISRKARLVREAGTDHVVGAVVLAEHGALADCREEIGDVVALEEF